MKYFPKPSKMPLDSTLSSSLQSWLGHELEMRGIDAVVYTRYILSILQQDSFDADLGERDFFPLSKKPCTACAAATVTSASAAPTAISKGSIPGPGANVSPVKVGKAQKSKKQDRKGTSVDMSSEQRKKTAAVECLRSVSDEDSGIEGLVDELCLKLKEQNLGDDDQAVPEKVPDIESSDSVVSTSPDDAAERYFAAFPALCDKGDSSANYSVAPASDTTWSRVAQKSSTEDEQKNSQSETNNQVVAAFITDLLSEEETPEKYRQSSTKPRREGGLRSAKAGFKSPGLRKTSNNQKKCPNKHCKKSGWQKGAVGGAVQELTFYEGYEDDQINMDWNQRMFRGRSQERNITGHQSSPILGRKNSCPDFSGFAQPAFIVPKMSTNSINMLHNHQYIAPPGGKTSGWYPVSPAKISLQEIFGTDEISKIEPCKTLVVDGQLVRLCATSVNSNKLSKKTNLSLQEAPMEELVAHKLWMEAEAEQAHCCELVHSETSPTAFQSGRDDIQVDQNTPQSTETVVPPGGYQEDLVEELEADRSSDGEDSALEQAGEDPVWYTGPIDIMNDCSPVDTGSRLYKRYSTEGSPPHSAMTTPTCNLQWEEVRDDSGVYIGAKLKESSHEEVAGEEEDFAFPFLRNMDMIAESSSDSDADYIDMSGSSQCHVPSMNKPYGDAMPFGSGLFPEAQLTRQGHRSPDRLQIFKELAGDNSDVSACDCSGESVTPEVANPLGNHEQTQCISQYKGCLTPEITQNKVPDDRPVFFLDEPELNNNNHRQHSASAKNFEQIKLVNHVNSCCTVSNLLGESSVPPLATFSPSSSRPSPFSIPSTASAHTTFSSQWSSSLSHLFHVEDSNHEEAQRRKLSQALFSRGLPASDYNWFANWSNESTFTMENTHMPKVSLSSFHCSEFSFITDSIWRDPPIMPIAPPSMIWDINLSQKITRESPLECAGSLNDVTKYVLNFSLDMSNVDLLKDTNFIEGGLYGGALNTDDAWSLTRSDCSEDEGIGDQDENLYFPVSPLFNLPPNKTMSADHLDSWFCDQSEDYLEVWTNKLTGSMELLPSEGSAFSRESLPSRLPYLPHVQSEPSMSPRQPIHKWGENKYRMVQVKHLYKPDTSILRHLGLASEAEEQEENRHRQETPEHHFKPISSPLNMASTAISKPVDVCKTAENCSYVILDGVSGNPKEEDSITLTDSVGYTADLLEELGALSSSMRSASGSLYQHYQGEETVNVSFVPKFKVCTENKYIQTGESPLHTSIMTEREFDRNLTERLVFEVLTADEEADELENLNMNAPDDSPTEYGMMFPEQEGSDVLHSSQYNSPTSIARFWDGEGSCKESCEDNPEMTSSVSSIDAANNISSIWCYRADDLPNNMPTDFSWEAVHQDPSSQDTLAAHFGEDLDAPTPEFEPTLTERSLEEFLSRRNPEISSAMRGNDTGIYAFEFDENIADQQIDLQELGEGLPADGSAYSDPDQPNSNHATSSPKESCPISIPVQLERRVKKKNYSTLEKESSTEEWLTDDSQNSDGEKMMFHMDAFDTPGEKGKHSYRKEKFQSSDCGFKSQLPRKNAKFRGNNIGFSAKPCSYFLEGKCQRSDCRYSHDISLVTCRFWKEGECFKGITCPFLHGYPA